MYHFQVLGCTSGCNAQVTSGELKIGRSASAAFRHVSTSGGSNDQLEDILINRAGTEREKEIDLIGRERSPRIPIRDLQDGKKRMSLTRVFGDRSDEDFHPACTKRRSVLNPVRRLCIHNMETW